VVTERWRPIPGWEGWYVVSDHGRVRGVDRILRNGNRYRGRSIAQTVRNKKNGYVRIQVGLSRDKWRTEIGVGRLVLMAFVGPCPDGMECCHVDGDSTNNHLSNLRWDTHSANVIDSVNHRTHREIARTECRQGHALPPHIPGYRRICLPCQEDRRRRRAAAV
jgi:hypothetical protein